MSFWTPNKILSYKYAWHSIKKLTPACLEVFSLRIRPNSKINHLYFGVWTWNYYKPATQHTHARGACAHMQKVVYAAKIVQTEETLSLSHSANSLRLFAPFS